VKEGHQPDDPTPFGITEVKSKLQYKTRWTVYHTLLVIGVWGIWFCLMYALRYGWGSL
jgi:hypothetical protein